jgi:uncharacterized damage-inducible protein DinB
MNASYFRMLFDYTYWAHRKVWVCIEALTEAQFTQPVDYAFGSIRGQVVHTMGAERIWLSRLNGSSPTAMLAESDYPTRADVRAAWDEIEADVRAHVNALNDDALLTNIVYRTMKGIEQRQPVYQLLAHLANHGTDHRAQTLSMLYQLGAPTVEQDLLLYYRERN